MTSEDLYAMQKRETEQSRMPGVLGIDLLREKPSRDRSGGNWVLAVPATNIRKLLSYAARADLWPGVLSEILTREKCGV